MEDESFTPPSSQNELAESHKETAVARGNDGSPLSLLLCGIHDKVSDADKYARQIARYVRQNAPELVQLEQATKHSYELVVDVSDDVKEKIAEGAIKLTYDKQGHQYAQLLQSNGKFGKKLPIKMEEIAGDVDAAQLASAMQMKALEQQLENVANQIEVIDGRVKEVLQGQQNDRIALFNSGMALYLEAREIEDPQLRNMLIAQAQRALADASAQLDLELQAAIQYLESGEYNKARMKREALIDEKMQAINRCFPVMHKAAIAKAAIYCEQGEPKAMAAALSAYSKMLESTVGKNAGLLAEFDKSDDGTEEGLWRSRSALQLDVDDLSHAINEQERVLYLLPADEEEGSDDDVQEDN
jgi:hypothetical protein